MYEIRWLTGLCALLLCYVFYGFALPSKHLKLDELVAASDVIAVVDVGEVQQVGTVVTTIESKDVKVSLYEADLHLGRAIKGQCPDEFSVGFYVPMEFMGYLGLETGPQLIFLKSIEGRLGFTDPHFPSFPAVAGSQARPEPSDSLDAVIGEMGSVLASPQNSSEDKLRILQLAYAVPNRPSFISALRAGLHATDDEDLRYRLEAHLLMRNDLTNLPSLTQSLFENALTDHEKDMLLSVIGTKIEDPRALPSVKHLLQSSDIPLRRAAAQALWRIADKSSQSAMIAVLNDPDSQVRFYAVRGLAETTGQREWGPANGLFEQDEEKYLRHWRTWGAAKTQR